jgi:hypothetical protein
MAAPALLIALANEEDVDCIDGSKSAPSSYTRESTPKTITIEDKFHIKITACIVASGEKMSTTVV